MYIFRSAFVFAFGILIHNASAQSFCKCERQESMAPRVLGGKLTEEAEFPFMAALVSDDKKRQVFCGATIISQNYLVTAATCLYGVDPSTVGVLIGVHNVTGSNKEGKHSIAQVIPHPMYSKNVDRRNDIALVRTASPIKFSEKVRPVCLPFGTNDRTFERALVDALGWGSIQHHGLLYSDVLRKTKLRVIRAGECSQRLMSNFNYQPLASQLCTYNSNSASDSCQGDEGGPLVYTTLNGNMYLTGVISNGRNTFCSSVVPTANTKLSSFVDWIVKNSEGETFC